MKSLVSNKEILNKLDFGSNIPIKDKYGYYTYLYKTTCLINGKVYVGIRSSKDWRRDRYIGCGIDLPHAIKYTKIVGHFKKAVFKYGFGNFNRENVLYFKNRRSAYRAERIVVDEHFINDIRTLNSCVGGNMPPRRIGDKNGNFGNKWSNIKKNKLSKFFKKNRNFCGDKNPKARKLVAIDIFNKVPLYFNTIKDCQLFLSLVDIGKYLYNISHIYRRKYIIIRYDIFIKKSIKEWMVIANNGFNKYQLNYLRAYDSKNNK